MRVLGVGKYRLFFLKRGKNGKLLRQHHLLDLVEARLIQLQTNLNSNENFNNKLILKFKPPNATIHNDINSTYYSKESLTVLEIGSDGFTPLSQLLHTIRKCYQLITYGFIPSHTVKLVSPPSYLLSLPDLTNVQGGGIIETYKAMCDYYSQGKDDQEKDGENKMYSKEVVHFLADIISAESTEIDLGLCPGVEDHSDLTFNLLPLFAALKHNVYFKTIIMRNINQKRGNVIQLISGVIRCNRTLERIVIDSYESGSIMGSSNNDFIELGEALKDNAKASAVKYIEFPNNAIGEKGIVSLANAFQSFTNNSLRVLNLNSCKISAFAISQLIFALEKNYGLSLSLETLDLSNNHFDEPASQSFTNWLSALKENSQLRVLKVASTDINLSSLAKSLTLLKKLQELDISGNKIDEGSCQVLCNLFESSSSLESLTISRCELGANHASQIAFSLLTNKMLKSVKFYLSDNGSSSVLNVTNNSNSNSTVGGMGSISWALAKSTNIHTLDLSGNHIKEQPLMTLLLSLVHLNTLTSLVLNNILKGGGDKDKLGSAFSSLIWSNPSIKELSLSGGYSAKVIIPLLGGLGKNSSLEVLNISNNKFGDRGASAISEFLRINRTLKSLKCDGNNITLSGWQCIRSAFNVNQTLVSMDWPWADFTRCTQLATSSRNRQLIQDILVNIQEALRVNAQRTKASPIQTLVQPAAPPVTAVPPSSTPLIFVAEEKDEEESGEEEDEEEGSEEEEESEEEETGDSTGQTGSISSPTLQESQQPTVHSTEVMAPQPSTPTNLPLTPQILTPQPLAPLPTTLTPQVFSFNNEDFGFGDDFGTFTAPPQPAKRVPSPTSFEFL